MATLTDIPYNYNVPATPDDPADDQPQMLINTQGIGLWTDRDHITFKEQNAGLHRLVRFPTTLDPAAIPPGPVNPPVSPPALFTQTVNSLPQLFWFSGDNSQTISQYVSGSTNASNGSTFLFGSNIIKWGISTIPTPGNTHKTGTVTFATEGVNSFPNKCFVVVGCLGVINSTVLDSGVSFSIRSYDQDKFVWVRNAPSNAIGLEYASFTWFAIGN